MAFSSEGPSRPKQRILFHRPSSFSTDKSPTMYSLKKDRYSSTLMPVSISWPTFCLLMLPTISSWKLYSWCSDSTSLLTMSRTSLQFWGSLLGGICTQTLKLVSMMMEQSSSLASWGVSRWAKWYRNLLMVKESGPSRLTSLILSSYLITSWLRSFILQRLFCPIRLRHSTSLMILQLLLCLSLCLRKPFTSIDTLAPTPILMKSKFSLDSLPSPIRPILHSLKISLLSLSSPSRLKNWWSYCSLGISSPLEEKGFSRYSLNLTSKCLLREYSGLVRFFLLTILSFSRLYIVCSSLALPCSWRLGCISPTTCFCSTLPPWVIMRKIMLWVNSSKERNSELATIGMVMRSERTWSELPQTSRKISPIILTLQRHPSSAKYITYDLMQFLQVPAQLLFSCTLILLLFSKLLLADLHNEAAFGEAGWVRLEEVVPQLVTPELVRYELFLQILLPSTSHPQLLPKNVGLTRTLLCRMHEAVLDFETLSALDGSAEVGVKLQEQRRPAALSDRILLWLQVRRLYLRRRCGPEKPPLPCLSTAPHW